jgi:hypothetical protein
MRRTHFMVRLGGDERAALQSLAALERRSQGDTLRQMIREAAERRGIWPTAETTAAK